MGTMNQLSIELQEQGIDLMDDFDLNDLTWWQEQDAALEGSRIDDCNIELDYATQDAILADMAASIAAELRDIEGRAEVEFWRAGGAA